MEESIQRRRLSKEKDVHLKNQWTVGQAAALCTEQEQRQAIEARNI